jgi:hypothetical protein
LSACARSLVARLPSSVDPSPSCGRARAVKVDCEINGCEAGGGAIGVQCTAVVGEDVAGRASCGWGAHSRLDGANAESCPVFHSPTH